MDVTLPDGTTVKDVPQGTTKAALAQKLKAGGMDVPDGWLAPKPEMGAMRKAAEYIAPVGVGEALLNLGSGMASTVVGGLAGVAGSVLPGPEGQGARVSQAVQEAATYQPRTAVGKGVSNALTAIPEAIAHGADKMGQKATDATGSPLIGTVVNTGLQSIPMLAGGLAGKVGPLKPAEAVKPEVKAARDAGFKMTPEEGAGGAVSKALSGLSGEPKLAKKISLANQATVDRLISEDLGLKKGAELSRDELARIRSEEGKAYEAAKGAGRITADAQYQADLQKIVQSYDTAAKDFAHRSENPFKKTVDGLNVGSFDAASLVEEVKLLRKDADKAFRTGDPGLGRSFRDAAQALDDMLYRHSLADPALVGMAQNLQNARVRIAKTYAAEDALNDATGHINPQKYAAMLEKGKPLAGPGLQVAEAAQAFPKSLQRTDKLGSTGGTLADALPGILSGGGWKEALAFFARPGIRSALTSDAGQSLINSPAASPAILEAVRKFQAQRGVAAAEVAAGQQ